MAINPYKTRKPGLLFNLGFKNNLGIDTARVLFNTYKKYPRLAKAFGLPKTRLQKILETGKNTAADIKFRTKGVKHNAFYNSIKQSFRKMLNELT